MTITCQGVNVLAVGSISISSTPIGAEIWLKPSSSGTYAYQGVTNATISGLVIGSYDIKLVKTGYQDWTTTAVIVTSGGTTVVDAALMGAHVATIPYNVMLQLSKHPLTDIGIKKFLDDWEKVPKK